MECNNLDQNCAEERLITYERQPIAKLVAFADLRLALQFAGRRHPAVFSFSGWGARGEDCPLPALSKVYILPCVSLSMSDCSGGAAVKIESAISLIRVVMEALIHRETCLKSAEKDVPAELLAAAVAELEADSRDTSGTLAWLSKHGVHVPQSAQSPPPYRRRANNQVPAEVEALIRDLLQQRWTKTAIAKHRKVNRRVVIRVAREAPECALAPTI